MLPEGVRTDSTELRLLHLAEEEHSTPLKLQNIWIKYNQSHDEQQAFHKIHLNQMDFATHIPFYKFVQQYNKCYAYNYSYFSLRIY